MSASRVAFLQAICENPDDDTVRLVFADWLDEQGDPERAEFIRLQIGIASGSIPEARLAVEEAHTEELFKRNETAWRGELPVRSGVTWETTPFTRGFVDTVGFRHGKAWKEHSEAVFAAAPISHLRCGGTFTARTARPVFTSTLLGRLSILTRVHFDENGAEALASNPHMNGRLRELHISGIDDGAADVLSQVSGLRNLETLTLGTIGPKGFAAIAGSPHLSRLKNLHVGSNPIGDEGAEALAASPHLSALQHVLLNYTNISDRGAVALVQAKHLIVLHIFSQ